MVETFYSELSSINVAPWLGNMGLDKSKLQNHVEFSKNKSKL